MKNIQIICLKSIIFLLIAFTNQSWSQNIKGFYVDGFHTILGNAAKEDSLLRFAKNNDFNYLTLYNLHNVNSQHPLANVTTSAILANFIYKAKTQYEILEIGGSSENFEFTRDVLHAYNSQHTNPLEKIDVYNLEFEWWNAASVDTGGYYCQYYLAPDGDTCNVNGALNYYSEMLYKIDSMANSTGLKSEAYLGWFDNPQAIKLVNSGVDRILLHIYLSSSAFNQNTQFNYVHDRLQALGMTNESIKVLPLYSSEPVFMQDWVSSNDYSDPYDLLTSSLQNITESWESNIHLEGFQWFAYSDMPKKNMTLSLPEKNSSFVIIQDRSNNTVTIQNQAETEASAVFTYQLIDLSGQTILKGNEQQPVINLNSLATSSYILRVSNKNATINLKIIK